jgi:hypothetical protein
MGEGDQDAPLEVHLRPWALVAPLLPFSLAMVSSAALLRDFDRALGGSWRRDRLDRIARLGGM